MHRKPEYPFLQRGYGDDQQAHEKMFSTANHEGNANLKNHEILPQTCQNGYHHKYPK